MAQNIIFCLLVMFSMGCQSDCEKYLIDDPQIGEGCGNVFVYKQFEVGGNPNSFISVSIDHAAVPLSKEFMEVDLLDNPDVEVQLRQYNTEGQPFCTDIGIVGFEMISNWKLVYGTVEARVVSPPTDCDDNYRVDVTIKNTLFSHPDNSNYFFDEVLFRNVLVGWIAG